MAHLMIFSRDKQWEIPLEKRDTTIGRSRECDIPIKGDPEISRIHCTIQRREDGNYLLLDEESRNGTYLNGKRVFNNQEHILAEGDEIRIGNILLRFYPSESSRPESAEESPGKA